MDRLNELRAQEAALLERSKVMLDTFPGPSWGAEHQTEWNNNMHRFTKIGAEIKALETGKNVNPAGELALQAEPITPRHRQRCAHRS